MKPILLLTAGGPLVILTKFPSVLHPSLLEQLQSKGVEKFIAFELPMDLVQERYAGHFTVVGEGLHESDELRVLDFDGQRAFRLFRFDEMGPPIFHEGG